MTNKEAIDWLICLKEISETDVSNIIGTWYKGVKDDHIKTLDMAIEALEGKDNVPDTNVGDTISRQAAIDAIDEMFSHEVNDEIDVVWNQAIEGASNKIKYDLPPAQPERPNGHWIFDFAHNEMTCSECGRTFTGGFDLENADNFCRHCGSDNRGEQDDS